MLNFSSEDGGLCSAHVLAKHPAKLTIPHFGKVWHNIKCGNKQSTLSTIQCTVTRFELLRLSVMIFHKLSRTQETSIMTVIGVGIVR